MDLNKIRNMNDDELRKYLTNLSNRDLHKCSICDKSADKIIKIENKRTCQTKSICGLCNSDYSSLLEFLCTTDPNWG